MYHLDNFGLHFLFFVTLFTYSWMCRFVISHSLWDESTSTTKTKGKTAKSNVYRLYHTAHVPQSWDLSII